MDTSFWTFQLPNLALAALMYTLMGRIILSFLFRSKPDAVILKVFTQVTDPVVKLVRVITPGLVAHELVLVLSIFWLLAARMALLMLTTIFGLAPSGVA